MNQTTPMPTPNMPDEVVEVMLAAFSEHNVGALYDTAEGERAGMRAAAIAALPLLLVDTGERHYCLGPNGEYHEPLYRLKVSNEQ